MCGEKDKRCACAVVIGLWLSSGEDGNEPIADQCPLSRDKMKPGDKAYLKVLLSVVVVDENLFCIIGRYNNISLLAAAFCYIPTM